MCANVLSILQAAWCSTENVCRVCSRYMYSKHTKHLSFYPSFAWFWLVIHLNSKATCLSHLIKNDDVPPFQTSSMQKKKPARNIHVSLAGRNEQRQHYLAGKRMTRQRAILVGEETSSDSDTCALFMGVSEEKGEEEKQSDGRKKEGKG